MSNLSRYRPNPPAASVEEYYRTTLYIPFLDSVILKLRERFTEKSKSVGLFDIILPVQCHKHGVQSDEFGKLMNVYLRSLQSNGLPFSLTQCANHYEKWVKKWQAEFSQETSPSTPVDTLLSCDPDIFPSVSALLEIASVLPVSTATVERSFSSLRLLKTYLRSTTAEDRLNGLTFMYTYSCMDIDIDSVIKRFASLKNRRSVFLEL